ncbi:MAG: 50S ribosomal protein L32e, partial [Candidatus Thermoplasmatota archaeon]|nr:50S ribosomal protein L32e [Candidatus Thermoplasmatota archaeon]
VQAEPDEASEVPLEGELDDAEDEDYESEDAEEYYEGDFEEWDDFHTSRQKPVLDEATKAALDMRSAQSKKQPAFRRQEWFRYRRLSKTGYRKPKGKDSKMRMNRKYRSPMARIGYGKIAAARGLHPSGFEEVMVHAAGQLDGLDPERQAVRIGSSVGNRKRSRIHDRADDLGLRVLNRRPIERKGDLR